MDKELHADDLGQVTGGAAAPALNSKAYISVASIEQSPFFDKLTDQLGFLKNRGYDKDGAVKVIANYIRETEGGFIIDSVVKEFVDKYW